MNDILNTNFEMKLHALFILAADAGNAMSIDKIVAADFITSYGKEYGLSDRNLHGDTPYKFSEIPVKRELITDAISTAVLDGLVEFIPSMESGMLYKINFKGIDFCNSFKTSYAREYAEQANKAISYLNALTDAEVLSFLNAHAVSSLKKGISADE